MEAENKIIKEKLDKIKAITVQKDKVDHCRQMIELHPDAFSISISGEAIEMERITLDLIRSTVFENLKSKSQRLLEQAMELMK